jgi:hypothetical protein
LLSVDGISKECGCTSLISHRCLVDQRPFLVFEVPRHKGSSLSDRHHKTRKCQGPYPVPTLLHLKTLPSFSEGVEDFFLYGGCLWSSDNDALNALQKLGQVLYKANWISLGPKFVPKQQIFILN